MAISATASVLAYTGITALAFSAAAFTLHSPAMQTSGQTSENCTAILKGAKKSDTAEKLGCYTPHGFNIYLR